MSSLWLLLGQLTPNTRPSANWSKIAIIKAPGHAWTSLRLCTFGSSLYTLAQFSHTDIIFGEKLDFLAIQFLDISRGNFNLATTLPYNAQGSPCSNCPSGVTCDNGLCESKLILSMLYSGETFIYNFSNLLASCP